MLEREGPRVGRRDGEGEEVEGGIREGGGDVAH